MATGKSIIKHYKKDRGFEHIPRELLQACDKKSKDVNGNERGKKGLSLQAIGLLVNLQSYPEDWEVNKTELYTRYSKNGKTSVMSAWDELVEHSYIIQFHKRVGKENQYIYYFNLTPFTKEEIQEVEKLEALKSKKSLSFVKSEAQNEKLKMRSSKTETNKEHIKENTQEKNTHKRNNDLNDLNNLRETEKIEQVAHYANNTSNRIKQQGHTISEDQYKKEMSFNKYPKMINQQLQRLDFNDSKELMNITNKAKKAVSKEYEDMKKDKIDFSYETHDIDISQILNRMILKAKSDNVSIEHLSRYISSSVQNYYREFANEELQSIIDEDMANATFNL